MQGKATNLALVVRPRRRSVACNDVVGDAKSALVVGLVQAHVNPGAVLLVHLSSMDVLLEHVLVRELHMSIDVLQPGRLAKADELVMDETIWDVVELVDVLNNCQTLVLYKVLDKSIRPMGTPRPM